MQIKLDKSDRRLLMWTGLILLPIIVVLALLSEDEQDSGVPTTYSAQSSGTKAAYLFLAEEGYNVERWQRSPEDLPTDAHNSVLVLASPAGIPTKAEKGALEAYLTHGGRILATGHAVTWFLPNTDVVAEPMASAVWKEYNPEILSSLTRAGTILMTANSHWGDTPKGQLVHYAHDGNGIVVSYKVGEGEVVWWGGNTPVSNAGIARLNNLGLLLNSLGASKETRIMWDEYFHGQRYSSVTLMVLPVWVGLGQCGLATLALLLTFARRNAPLRPLAEPSRLSPLEFVQTMGKLYRRANTTRTALEVPYNSFRALLVRRLGLRHDVSSAELLQSARKTLGYQGANFEDTVLEVLKSIHDPYIKEAKVLELVQKLNQHARNLKLISQESDGSSPMR